MPRRRSFSARRAVRSPVQSWVGCATLVVTLLLGSPAHSQILNTLRGFVADAPGWSGEVGAFVSASGGNTENVSASGAGRVQWQGEVQRWRLFLEGTRAESRRETTEEATALHLRHNARLTGSVASLAFVQHQHDRFQRVDARFLLGAGVRWDAMRGERIEGSWGLSPMLEVERVEGRDAEARGRLSTFLTVLGHINDRTRVDVTGFVQPAFAELSDVRAVGLASLRVEISGQLSLLVDGRLQYDAEPAEGVEETDWKTRTGLSVTL